MKYMDNSKVALLSSKSYGEESKRAVEKAVNLIGGLEQIVHSGDTVLIKPNLVNAFDAISGNTTHFSLVDQLINMCYDMGADEIIVGEGSADTDTFEAFKALGMKKVVDKLKGDGIPVKFVDLNFDKNPETNEFDAIDLGAEALNSGHVYRVAHTVLRSDVVISVPKLKTHNGPGITVTLKNMIGTAPGGFYGFPKKGGTNKSVNDNSIERADVLPHGTEETKYDLIWRTIIDLNRIMLGKYAGSPKKRRYLAVVDGIVAGAYDNINSRYDLALWTPVNVGVIIAGQDPVAVDTVSSRVMRLRPERIPQLSYASEAGLGTMNNLKILGDKLEDVRKFVTPADEWLNISDMKFPKIWLKVQYRNLRKIAYTVAAKPSVHKVLKKLHISKK
jgi:uncharacterized protein (DUF362 family)